MGGGHPGHLSANVDAHRITERSATQPRKQGQGHRIEVQQPVHHERFIGVAERRALGAPRSPAGREPQNVQNAGSESVLDVERVAKRLVEADTGFEAQMADRRGVEDVHRNRDHVVTADHAGPG